MKWSDAEKIWEYLQRYNPGVERSDSPDVAVCEDSLLRAIGTVIGLESDTPASSALDEVNFRTLCRRIDSREAELAKAKALAHEQEQALLREGIRADSVAAELKLSRTQLADLHVRHQELHDNYEAMQKKGTQTLPELAHWTQIALDRGKMINELKAALKGDATYLRQSNGQLHCQVDDLKRELADAKRAPNYQAMHRDHDDLKQDLEKAICSVGSLNTQLESEVVKLKAELKKAKQDLREAKQGTLYRLDDIHELKAELAKAKDDLGAARLTESAHLGRIRELERNLAEDTRESAVVAGYKVRRISGFNGVLISA